MRKSNQGKLTITGIIVILLICYGAFAAVKIISTKLTVDEIQKRVKDRLGRERGFSLTEPQAEDIIYEVLSKQKEIIFGDSEEDSISVTIDTEKKILSYYFEYSIQTDLIFTKTVKRVRVNESMASFR